MSRPTLAPAVPCALDHPLAEGREAKVYLLDCQTVFRVDKVQRESVLDRSLCALDQALAHGVPVPAFHHRATVAGLAGVAMERLEPESLLQRLGRLPWTIGSVGRIMGMIHSAIHMVPGPTGLPSTNELILEPMVGPSRGLTRRLSKLESHSDADRLLHCDFNPANLLRRPATGEWLAVDWSGAARGDPMVDVAYTLVMIATGAPPVSLSPLFRAGASVGRQRLASAYLSEYMRHHRIDRSVLKAWQAFWFSTRAERMACR